MKAFYFKIYIVLLSFLLCTLFIHAQNNVGINTSSATPNNSAILDLNTGNTWTGTNGKGLLLPRMNTTEQNAIVSPAIGLSIFNTDCETINYWNGVTWIAIGTPTNFPSAPTVSTNVPYPTYIVWNWNTITSATGYQWNTTSTYPGSGVNVVTTPTYTQTGLSCATTYTLYVWAYNSCGNSTESALVQITSACLTCGTQVWASTNLNVGTYTSVASSYGNLPAGYKWCYNNTLANCALYGGLYDWQNTMGGAPYSNTVQSATTIDCNPCTTTSTPAAVQGICPTGYHVPSDLEWSQYEWCLDPSVSLSTYQTTGGSRGTTVGSMMKYGGAVTLGGFNDGSTNSSGFSALAGGYGWGAGASDFMEIGLGGLYWSATEAVAGVWGSGVGSNNSMSEEFFSNNAQADRSAIYKTDGSSVRCLQN